MSVIQRKYTGLEGKKVEELVDQYNIALQQAYDSYLDKVITYEEADTKKVHLFFASLGLSEPTLDEVKEFRTAYKAVYRENRRATPGSVETLARLREHRYRIAIITNGQIEDQLAKAKAIGILNLIDRIITSEETGSRKPDSRIFQYTIHQLGASLHTTYMVGDSADADIKGALDAQLAAIMYSPTARDSQRLLFGQQIPVIRHMSQLLGHFGIISRRFEPHFASSPGQLVIEGTGVDMVTEPRHHLCVSKETVKSLAESMGLVLARVAEKRYIAAMSHIESMIRAIAMAADLIDEVKIQVYFSGRGQGEIIIDGSGLHLQVTDRDHSICAEYPRLALDVDLENEAALREVASLLQGHFNDLMRDYPRAAIRQLRSAVLVLAHRAGVSGDTIITGEDVDA
ncbi:hypothetical protein ACJ41O_006094 [Fusarium nematophilum]